MDFSFINTSKLFLNDYCAQHAEMWHFLQFLVANTIETYLLIVHWETKSYGVNAKFAGSVNPFLLLSFVFFAVVEITEERTELENLKTLTCTHLMDFFFGGSLYPNEF